LPDRVYQVEEIITREGGNFYCERFNKWGIRVIRGVAKGVEGLRFEAAGRVYSMGVLSNHTGITKLVGSGVRNPTVFLVIGLSPQGLLIRCPPSGRVFAI